MIRKPGNKIGIRLYPNPISDNLKIEFSKAKGNYIISLLNQLGQEVRNKRVAIAYDVQTETINRNNLTNGTYFVRVKNLDGSEVYAEKVIIQD